MKRHKLALLFGLPFLLAGCGGEEAEVAEEPVAAPVEDVAVVPVTPPVAPAAGAGTTISLMPMNNSGATGEAMLTPMNNQTQVMVRLTSTPVGTHEGHIHQGTCANLGDVVVPLQPIEVGQDGTGTMTTTVDVAPSTVMNGQHLIAYHEAGGDPGTPIVCGEIPAGTMPAGTM